MILSNNLRGESKLQKQLLASGLALSLFAGGVGLCSNAVSAAPITEKEITINQTLKDEEYQPTVIAALSRAALLGGAFSVGKAAGKAVTNAVFGDNAVHLNNYNYEDIKESFDN